MSYTPYKPLVEKFCVLCKVAFQTRLDKKRFCSESCRKEFQGTIYRGTCPHCKGDLYPKGKENG